jgi:DNA primase
VSFSQEFIDKVRDANNIVDLFSEFTELKRSGHRLMGLCPFPGHVEKSPSFSVSEDKQLYHCFGCGRSGQIFIALQELKGLNFPDAVEYLANKANIAIPVSEKNYVKKPDEKSKLQALHKINKTAAEFFHKNLIDLPSHHYLKKYCEKRGLTSEIIKLFSIGYALNDWSALTNQFQKLNTPLNLANNLGLLRPRKEGEGYYDLFRDRLMFPIDSQQGECIGFGGRALSDEQTPKYLNSPESELFSKGRTFYGLHETAKYIRTEDAVIVVEGYMDFLALYAVGIKNVVATLGTALTANHAKIIKRQTSNVIVLFDGDEAGKNAAERSLPILLAEELLPKAVILPDELDPDEFVKERGVDSLKQLIRSSPDLFSVILDRHLLNYRGSSADKVVLLDNIALHLDAIRDVRLKDLYVSEIALKIGVEADWARHQVRLKASSKKSMPLHASHASAGMTFDQHLAHNHAKEAEFRAQITPNVTNDVIIESETAKIDLKDAPKAELFLLNISLLSPKLFNDFWNSGVFSELSHKGVSEMLLKAQSRYRQMPNEFAKLSAYLMNFSTTPKLLGLHLAEPFISLDDESQDKFLKDCVRQVKQKFLKNKSRELSASLRLLTDEDRNEKLEQIMNIQKSKHTLRRDQEP